MLSLARLQRQAPPHCRAWRWVTSFPPNTAARAQRGEGLGRPTGASAVAGRPRTSLCRDPGCAYLHGLPPLRSTGNPRHGWRAGYNPAADLKTGLGGGGSGRTLPHPRGQTPAPGTASRADTSGTRIGGRDEDEGGSVRAKRRSADGGVVSRGFHPPPEQRAQLSERNSQEHAAFQRTATALSHGTRRADGSLARPRMGMRPRGTGTR